MNGPPRRKVVERLRNPLADQGRRQPLGRPETMVFLGMVSGENSERGIAAWIAEERGRLKRGGGVRRDAGPSSSTIQRAMHRVDGAELERALGAWIDQVQAATVHPPWAGIAMEGKGLHGSAEGHRGALDGRHAFRPELGVGFGQRSVGRKPKESPESLPLLEELTLTGQVVTVEARHTQRPTAQASVEKGGPTA